jgi:capsular exopolysaccharide synthesis family protein
MESTESPNFYHYWSIFRRRWPYAVATFASVVTLTYFYAITRAPIYGAQGKLLFKQDQSSSLIKFDSQNQQQNNANSSPDDRSQATEAKVISSTPNLQKALKRINIIKQRKEPLKLEELQQGVEIGSLEKTDIMQVSYKGQDPKLAALVVNELMKVYIESHLESSRAAAASAAKFIGAQLPRVKGEVYSADLAVRNFKEKYQITDLGQTQGAIAANLERIGSQIDSVEAELAALNSRSKTLQEKLGVNAQQALSVNSLSKSPVMQGVLQDLREVQGKLAEARSRYLESSPGIVQLKDKEAQLKRTIQNQYAQILQQQQTGRANKLQIGQIQEDLTTELIKLEVHRTGLASQLTVLSNQRSAYRKKAAVLPRLEQQLREDQRELSAAQSTYEALLKSLQEIKVIENQTVGNVRIIEAAQIPQQPINSNKTSAMMAGSLAGILLSAAVVYLLEKIDKRIKSLEQVRELFEYTLLATIPDFSKTSRSVNAIAASDERRLAIPVLDSYPSFISESFRMLHANMTFFSSDKVMQVIVVTSSVPKEGKSTTVANLAAVIANLGYRVLIVDADLRRPSQHEMWQIPNEAGLKNFIAARGDLSSPIVQKVIDNLYVLSAGSVNSSSPVFIDSRSMATLIRQCQNKYDYVIFDTPPLAVTADAHILGKIADGVMLVTRPSIADSINSKQAKDSLDRSGQKMLGIVVNGVRSENKPYGNNSVNYFNESVDGANGVAKSRSWMHRLRQLNRF